jgi:hypothetical protein
MRPYLEKTHHRKVLVEWLKVQTVSSSPGTVTTKTKTKIVFNKIAQAIQWKIGVPISKNGSETIGYSKIKPH